ncbi:MAG TPA: TetR/AcrR family transcriptional regulator [Candidatus Nanopelagicaceae bacterium]|nr:TetR/AcrR family transcriptional regulator [Candidatus Nanopelagicaceae bacterium]
MGTRERLLETGAVLFAEKGFHGVGVEELGASVGLTGPAIYRHFRTKSALLAEMLIRVSESLLAGATELQAEMLSPEARLSALIERHVAFAFAHPALIKVQERDFANLAEADARQVRRLQRRYVELWGEQILLVNPGASVEDARTMAHAIFGMLNSTPRLKPGQRRDETAVIMRNLASKALLP